MGKVIIKQDYEACIGCGSCVAVCPDNWDLAEGKAKPKRTVLKEVGCNEEAAGVCPVQCIKVIKE